MRRTLATALAILLVLSSSPSFAAAPQGQTPGAPAAALKQQLVSIPAGAVVEVRLQQKASAKLTGKLGTVTDEGFEVQTVKSGKVSTEKLAFADVKSVKEKKGMHVATKALIATGVVIGVLFAIVGIAVAAGAPLSN